MDQRGTYLSLSLSELLLLLVAVVIPEAFFISRYS
jgi:hypothetical protein